MELGTPMKPTHLEIYWSLAVLLLHANFIFVFTSQFKGRHFKMQWFRAVGFSVRKPEVPDILVSGISQLFYGKSQ